MDSRLGSTRLHSRRHARSLQPTMGATTARQLKGSGSIPPRQRRLDGWASSASFGGRPPSMATSSIARRAEMALCSKVLERKMVATPYLLILGGMSSGSRRYGLHAWRFLFQFGRALLRINREHSPGSRCSGLPMYDPGLLASWYRRRYGSVLCKVGRPKVDGRPCSYG